MNVVISGISLFEGGPLSVFYDCLNALRESGLWQKHRIILFVHKRSLFESYGELAEIIELPKARKNYLNRLYYEYFFFYRYSLKHHVDLWLSLHDITPRVRVNALYTYCHNPSPFLKKDHMVFRYGGRVLLFSFFYRYLYRINIRSARAVIVQQDWIRKEFYRMFPVKCVAVARPTVRTSERLDDRSGENSAYRFVYAAYPRFFKNFEVILRAARLLEKQGARGFEICLTIDGTENRYTRDLKKEFQGLKTVHWMGILPRTEVFRLYETADVLIFPSRMETWGLPVSEYKETGKPILLADLPYAHETLGDYNKADFFAPENEQMLAEKMRELMNGKTEFQVHRAAKVLPPYAENWSSLLEQIFENTLC